MPRRKRRFIRVSERGRWHIADHVIERTAVTVAACGRLFRKPEEEGMVLISVPDSMTRVCAKCALVLTPRSRSR